MILGAFGVVSKSADQKINQLAKIRKIILSRHPPNNLKIQIH